MGVYLGAGYVVMTQKLLDDPHIRYPQQIAGKGVAEHVRIDSMAKDLQSGCVYESSELLRFFLCRQWH
ncbi:hypothetical protein ES705_37187 [subsurface metagenome]